MPTMEKKSECQRPPMATTTIGMTGVWVSFSSTGSIYRIG